MFGGFSVSFFFFLGWLRLAYGTRVYGRCFESLASSALVCDCFHQAFQTGREAADVLFVKSKMCWWAHVGRLQRCVEKDFRKMDACDITPAVNDTGSYLVSSPKWLDSL